MKKKRKISLKTKTPWSVGLFFVITMASNLVYKKLHKYILLLHESPDATWVEKELLALLLERNKLHL